MIKVGILGASGYTGVELIRLLLRHPEAEIVALTSEKHAQEEVSHVFPSLKGWVNLSYQPLAPTEIAQRCDLLLVALPHGTSMKVVPSLIQSGKKVIDLSADFRLRDSGVYQQWYGHPHACPDLLEESVYGLPELNRSAIASSFLVANPGCYPTGVILALAPLIAEGMVEDDLLLADCKSGISGAGRQADLSYQYCERNEGLKAYQLGVHRHIPEMEQQLSRLAKHPIKLSFTPHLVPMSRGILSTVYARPHHGVRSQEIRKVFEEFYDQEFFIRIFQDGSVPDTRHVLASNCCDIGVSVDERTGWVIVVSALDNLVKGASGQAIQNMNLMSGFPEQMGLEGPPLFP